MYIFSVVKMITWTNTYTCTRTQLNQNIQKLLAHTRTHSRAPHLNTVFLLLYLRIHRSAMQNDVELFSSPLWVHCFFSGIQPKNEWSMFAMLICSIACMLRASYLTLLLTTHINTHQIGLTQVYRLSDDYHSVHWTLMEWETTNTNDLNKNKNVNETKQTAWRCGFCHSTAIANQPNKPSVNIGSAVSISACNIFNAWLMWAHMCLCVGDTKLV